MPVLEVTRYRCKHCQDSGFITVARVFEKHPHNDRPVSNEDKRTGLEFHLGFNYSRESRFQQVEVSCTFCPPLERPVYRRDWERRP